MKRVWLAVILCVAVSGSALAHLCNNIYRTPDRLVVKPERDDLSVDKSEDFRVFVRNNYPTRLDNVRLDVKVDDPSCQITVDPQSIRLMRAGEKAAFNVRVDVGQGARAGRRTLQVGVSANQVGFRPAAEAGVSELRQVLSGDNPAPKVLACESLARRGDREGTQWLQTAINGSDRAYVVRALRAAGLSGNRGLAGVVAGKLADADGMVRGNALLALGLLGAERASIRGLVSDADEFVRTCACAALAMQGDQGQLAGLRQALGSGNKWAQAAAAWGLGLQGEQSAVDTLDRLFDSADDDVKVMAGDALVNIAGKFADLRQIAAPAGAPGKVAAPAPGKPAPPSGKQPPRKAPPAPGQPPMGKKLTTALGYLCGLIGLIILGYVAHQKWGVRRRR